MYTVVMVKRHVIEDVVKTIPVISAADVRAKGELIPPGGQCPSGTAVKAKLSAFNCNEEVSSSGQQISFQCPVK